MSFVRNDRNDRRRRVIREAAAADSELAVESVRARKRQRLSDRSEQDDSIIPIRRDPGYSQAVRKACQQRLVQLIPVRRSTLSLVLISAWSVWGLLLLSHYLLHVRPYVVFESGAAQLGSDLASRQASSPPLPISYLLHLRSSHGIAHWLGGQLWMLTALAALMIFQLKRHKLDDYRAKYRVWMMLSIAALVSSMDASTSALLLLGKSIDGWALREVGYSGWSLVLATFATLVGMLGLRLLNELKSAPASIFFWLGGLLSWALSAVVGTGLLKTTWSQSQTDMIVGGAWLGGILSVFMASGIYLRHVYIQAQRRFVIRHGMISEAKQWKMPSLKLRRKSSEPVLEDEPISEPKTNRRQVSQQAAVADRLAKNESQTNPTEARSNNRSQTSERPTIAAKKNEKLTDQAQEDSSTTHEHLKSRSSSSGWKLPSLRLPKWKSNPSLGDDYSDVNADNRLRDKGFSEPMTKKPSWFAKRPAVDTAANKTTAADKLTSKAVTTSSHNSSSVSSQVSSSTSSGDVPDFNEVGAQRKSWWKRSGAVSSGKTIAEKPAKASVSGNKSSSGSAGAVAKPKKSWGLLPRRTMKEPGLSPNADSSSAKNADNPAEKKVARKWFGMLDGLKLKPPADSVTKSSSNKPNSNAGPSKAVGPPSSSSAAKFDPPLPTKSSTPIQVNRTPSYEAGDEDDDDQANRGLSRADRKRLKKQQQENRRAA